MLRNVTHHTAPPNHVVGGAVLTYDTRTLSAVLMLINYLITFFKEKQTSLLGYMV